MSVDQQSAGLRGVVAVHTSLGGVDGDKGRYHYRGQSVPELADSLSLESVWQLLSGDRLAPPGVNPTETVGRLRVIDVDSVVGLRRTLATGPQHPYLSSVRSGISHIGQSWGLESWLGSPEGAAAAARKLAAVVPVVVSAGWRLRNHLEPLLPDPSLSHVADFLRMLGSDPADERKARALEQYLILTVDHGLNASTFAARVVTSTGADPASAFVAGISALSGPLHGGAPHDVLEMLADIGAQSHAESWVRRRLEAGRRIMGFGHGVYMTEDPRATKLREIVRSFSDPLVEVALAVEHEALRQLEARHPDRPLKTNVEYYAAVLLALIGIPKDLFPACFAISRAIGWSEHVIEQIGDNRLIRPTSVYQGAGK